MESIGEDEEKIKTLLVRYVLITEGDIFVKSLFFTLSLNDLLLFSGKLKPALFMEMFGKFFPSNDADKDRTFQTYYELSFYDKTKLIVGNRHNCSN